MVFSGVRVLLAEGRARQCLPLIRSLKKHGCIVYALCVSKLDVAYVSRFTDYRILGICDRQRETETKEQIITILKEKKIDVVIPTTDFIAGLLSKNKDEFSLYSKIAIVDYDIFKKAEDKQLTMETCMEANLPCPITLNNVTSIEDIKNNSIHFPIVMKPKIGYGAIGFKVINCFEQLEKELKQVNSISDYIFQEYIPQTDIQYECAMFMDKNQNVKTSLVFSKNRWFPISGGSSTLNITVNRPDIVEICSKLLKKIGWVGAADIDLIQDPRDNTAKIMEINPRVSGSVRIAFDAGTDLALQMLQLLYDKEIIQYEDYKIGRRLRCSQTDLLWFLKSPNRFKAKPNWFSNKKTNDQVFYFSDPIPWFAFTIQGLKNYKKEIKKRS